MPKVSICIPAYKADHFRLCLASAVAQTYENIEILVSDDCPNDEVRQICDSFSSHLSYSRNPNPGYISNVSRLIELASGEYIKFIFDDDFLTPFCVQRMVFALESSKNENTVLAFSNRLVVNSKNYVLTGDGTIDPSLLINFNDNKENVIYKGIDLIKQMLIKNDNYIGEFTTTMFRKSDCFDCNGKLKLFGLGDFEFTPLGDMASWINLLFKGAAIKTPGVLSYFRLHENSRSNPSTGDDFTSIFPEFRAMIHFAKSAHLLNKDELVLSYKNLIIRHTGSAAVIPVLKERLALEIAVLENELAQLLSEMDGETA